MTPRSEAKYNKINEEFDLMMQRSAHMNGTRVRGFILCVNRQSLQWTTWFFRHHHQEYLQSLWICHSIHHLFLKTILVSFNRTNYPLNQPALQGRPRRGQCWIWIALPRTDTTDHVHHLHFLVVVVHPIQWEVAEAVVMEVGSREIHQWQNLIHLQMYPHHLRIVTMFELSCRTILTLTWYVWSLISPSLKMTSFFSSIPLYTQSHLKWIKCRSLEMGTWPILLGVEHVYQGSLVIRLHFLSIVSL